MLVGILIVQSMDALAKKKDHLYQRWWKPVISHEQYAVFNEMCGRAGNRNASVEGGLAVAVPLELKGMWMAHRQYGRHSWGSLVSPAATLARNGFPAHPYLINALNESSIKAK